MNVSPYYYKFSMLQLYLIVIIICVQCGTVMSKTTDNEEKCVWFNECGPDPTPGRNSKTLNCYYDGEPGKTDTKIYIHY